MSDNAANRYDVLQALLSPGGNMARWRGEQKGILEKRSRGWFGRWREYVERDGEIRWEQITRKLGPAEWTKGEAQAELNARLAVANGPAAVRQNLATLQQFVDVRYVPDCVERLAPKTQEGYRWILDHCVLPQLGQQRLRDFNSALLNFWMNTLTRRYASQTCRTAMVLMKGIFNHAVAMNIWRGELPTAGVKPPKLRRTKQAIALTEAQAEKVIEQLKEPARTLVLLLAHTGMRIGEALALDWQHVNLNETSRVIGNYVVPGYSIAVRRNWSAGQFKDSPKTPSGERNIPISASLWVTLMQIRQEEGLMFMGANGKPLDAHNLANRALKKAAKAIGLPRLGFHVFRHTVATIAQQKGMKVAEVRGVLGHAHAATTMLYTHGSTEEARKYLDKIQIEGKPQ